MNGRIGAYAADEEPPRQYCRNPRCRSKLPAPVENRHHGFCSRTCHSSFYRQRCVVCEGAKRSEKAATCGRRCRAERRRLPLVYPVPGQYPFRRRGDSKSARKSGPKTAPTDRRVWRKVAGPDLHEINFRVALDLETAGRVRRANEKFERRGSRSVPLNLIGARDCCPGPRIDREVAAEILATEIGPISARSHPRCHGPELNHDAFLSPSAGPKFEWSDRQQA